MGKKYFSLMLILALCFYAILSGPSRGENLPDERVSPVANHASIEINRAAGQKIPLRANVEFCSNIENKRCLYPKSLFMAGVEKVFCHTTISGAPSYMEITHIWYYGDKVVQRVRLPVKSLNWRTWSVKSIAQDENGKWKVEVYCGGMKIGEGKFTVLGGGQNSFHFKNEE